MRLDYSLRTYQNPDAIKPNRPKPKNKNTTAHFPILEDNGDGTHVPISGIIVAMAWIIGQIDLRRRIGQVLIVIMDGQESLWNAIKMSVSFGARSMLNLRAVFQSDHWSEFLKQNMESETCRIHAHREVLNEYEHLTIAC